MRACVRACVRARACKSGFFRERGEPEREREREGWGGVREERGNKGRTETGTEKKNNNKNRDRDKHRNRETDTDREAQTHTQTHKMKQYKSSRANVTTPAALSLAGVTREIAKISTPTQTQLKKKTKKNCHDTGHTDKSPYRITHTMITPTPSPTTERTHEYL